MCVNSASTVLRGGRSTIYRKVKRLSSTRLATEEEMDTPLLNSYRYCGLKNSVE